MRKDTVLAPLILSFVLLSTAASATCPTFHTLTNGMPADASQVMDNFNNILNCARFTGNVGIGLTGSPRGALDIENVPLSSYALSARTDGAGRGVEVLTPDFVYGSTGSAFSITAGAASGNTYVSLDAYTAGKSASGNLIVQAAGGNVGIGTTNPVTILQVQNNADSDTELSIYNTTVGASAQAALHVQSDAGYSGLFKYSTAHTSYKIVNASDVVFYNSAGGNIDVLNDNASGNISFAAGGASTAQLLITSSGNVGIGTTSPGTALQVIGIVTALDFVKPSDRRLKTDISPFSADALTLVRQLKPVTFAWKRPRDDSMRGRQIGFIAQDVQQVLPEVVLTLHDADSTLGLKYDSLIPVLTKAIQEQQAQIDALTVANQKQAAVVQRFEARLGELERRARIRTAKN